MTDVHRPVKYKHAVKIVHVMDGKCHGIWEIIVVRLHVEIRRKEDSKSVMMGIY